MRRIRENGERIFSTIDPHLSAFLECQGFMYNTRKGKTKVCFEFIESEKLNAAILAFNDNERIGILDYIFALKKVWGQMKDAMRANERTLAK